MTMLIKLVCRTEAYFLVSSRLAAASMPKKRDLKNKFRQFPSSSSSNNIKKESSAKASTEESNVTAKLNKLRVEQARAERNRGQRKEATDVGENQPQWQELKQTRRTAGPPPPRSWIVKEQELNERPIHVRPRNQTRPWQQQQSQKESTVQPLWQQCAFVLCKQVAAWYATDRRACMRQIARLPIKTKQMLLRAFAESSSVTLTNQLLTMFGEAGNEEYSELCLEGASISMECLVKTFWNVRTYQTTTESISEDWEEAAEEIEHAFGGQEAEYIHDPEQHNECTWHLRLLLHMARHSASIDLSKHLVLYTPLSAKLTTLNLSFIQPPVPAVGLAYLITQTLPDLQILSVAGTFPGKQGQQALSVLSRGLRKLTVWDIGYHAWLEANMLCDDTSPSPLIHWNRDLLNLQILVLQCCGASQNDQVGNQVKQWLLDHCGSRKIDVYAAAG